jgi:hypothetical protein
LIQNPYFKHPNGFDFKMAKILIFLQETALNFS